MTAAAATTTMTADEHVATLARNWWMLTLRGVFAILFGVLTWLQPAISLAVLVLLFGAYALADGVIGAWAAVSGRKTEKHWWAWLLWSLVSVVVGILTFTSPAITALVLVLYIGFWAVASGIMEIVTGIRLRKAIEGEWLLMLSGILSVLFGIVLLVRPAVGALAMMWLIAVYAVVFGILMVMLGGKLRRVGAGTA